MIKDTKGQRHMKLRKYLQSDNNLLIYIRLEINIQIKVNVKN